MKIAIYDATITEGAREAGVQLSVRDRLRIALRLAEAGVAFIECGWAEPPTDPDLFQRARRLEMGGARLCACACIGTAASRRTGVLVRSALSLDTPAITLSTAAPLAPGGVRGSQRARRRTGPSAAGAEHVAREVKAVREAGRLAVVEIEDFFSAMRQPAAAVVRIVEAAARAGAEAILLSDTDGGALPHEVQAGVLAARRVAGRAAVGIRARNDAGVAVANTLAAVAKGATVAVATVNGYGDRCGAADLASIAAALELKMGHQALAAGQLRRMASLASFVADLSDREMPRNQPYVGHDAFVRDHSGAPPHVDPVAVGNRAEPALADERGHPDALRVARALGLPARGEADARRVLDRLHAWERRGFRYEGAEASFELLLRELAGKRRAYFSVSAYRVIDVRRQRLAFTEATVELTVAGRRHHTAALGVGPVNALDRALRTALDQHYPGLGDMQLVQSRSRALPTDRGTAGVVRVQIESADGHDHWGTAGVSDNLLDACCQALVDAIEYKLLKDDVPAARRAR